MKNWSVSYSAKEGPRLNVYRTPLWALVAENLVERACDKLGHVFCSPPEWTFRVPLSLAKDSEGYWESSLGDKIYSLGTRGMSLGWEYEERVTSVELTDEEFKRISPDFAEGIYEQE